FGYSAALRAVPLAGATGAVTANAGTSSFFPPRNIFLAAPKPPELDPVFSVIVPLAQGGVFVNANTADGSAVASVPEVNDMLAEIAFDVGASAQGVFEVQLGPASALANASGLAVPFRTCLARISVGVTEVQPGDFNGDGEIDALDLALLLGSWGDCPEGACPADLNCDGVVDALDLSSLLGDWN
ncbi:MAG: Dockerin type domain, partial [Planctomycetota bacterium]